jgi:hypothetical protein
MKSPLFLLVMLAGTHLSAQQKQDIPAFGKIDKSDLLMKECDFDQNAEAVVLFDAEEVYCKMAASLQYYQHVGVNGIFSEITRHVRIKILKNKGMEKANIKIPYESGFGGESFDHIEAQTYNLDETGNIVVTKLANNAVADQEVNGKVREKVFTFADVKIGSVIEYTYKVSGNLGSGLRDWEFQTSIPCKLSRYSLAYSPGLQISSSTICSQPVAWEDGSDKKFIVNTFTMTNVAALRDEPFMTCEKDYLQRVESRLVAVTIPGVRINLALTWTNLVQGLMKDDNFGLQISKEIPKTDDLNALLKNIEDPYAKMSVIYRYVREHIEWNGKASFSAKDGVKTAWKQRRGNSGEINFILINLLRNANLDARPILLSTRTNGRVNTAYLTNQEFDKVMAYVVIDEQTYVLDASNKYCPPDLIPWEVMYSDGLIIDNIDSSEGNYALKRLWTSIWDEKKKFHDVVQIIGSIDQQGLLTGDASIKSYDYSRSRRIPDLKLGRDEFIEKYFGTPNPGVHIDSSSVENDQIDTLPLLQKIWFNEKVSSSGDNK